MSPGAVREMVVGQLERHRAGGALLDFGAGAGAMLRRLSERGGFERLAGVDLFARPVDLPASIEWHRQDLNDAVALDGRFDVVVCSETIEHLENPRHVFRGLHRLLADGGLLVLTMPNQESLRSYAGLVAGGHFTSFLDSCYPAHITALLRADLVRICRETGFGDPDFCYTDEGAVPKLTRFTWQQISFGLLRGRLFSDNLGMTARRSSAA